MALVNLSIYYTRKNVKSIYKNNKYTAPTWNETLKYQRLLGMKHLIYLMDRMIYQKYKTILNI